MDELSLESWTPVPDEMNPLEFPELEGEARLEEVGSPPVIPLDSVSFSSDCLLRLTSLITLTSPLSSPESSYPLSNSITPEGCNVPNFLSDLGCFS
jgi:hypothetical protein